MNILADLILVAVIALCAFIGRKNGFVKTIFSFFSSIVAFIVASLLSRPIGAFLGENVFYPFFEKHVLTALSEGAGKSVAEIDFSALPEACKAVLSRFQVTEEALKGFLAESGQTAGQATADAVGRYVAEPIAHSVGVAVAFAALFIVSLILLRILSRALDLISKLPVLNFSNRTLGLVIGLVFGLFIAFLLSGILSLSEPMLQGVENAFFQAFDVEETVLLKLFSKVDLLSVFSVAKG